MTNMCDYDCGRPAIIQFKGGKFCCELSKNKCPALKKKNSNGQAKNGGVWNKGLTKDTDSRVEKYGKSVSDTKLQLFKDGKLKCWNDGLTKETDIRVFNNVKDLSKNRRGYYHTLQYYVDKLGPEEGVKKYKSSNLLKSQSLKNFILRYGEDLGKAKYKEYKSNQYVFYSKISQELFWKIYNSLNDKSHIYFSELNKEFGKQINTDKYVFYDFTNTKTKKIIEFNGDFFHANPKLFSENSMPNPYTDETAKEIWGKDKNKIEYIQKEGFKVFIVWESDYKRNKEETFQKCIEFLS